ncbi:CMP/dCMP deaminase zinc-binding [Beutenbergia cavernae DSM 12333]|uniref:CMP/dCMP deaminase zinc-binding n=1 Tax=Beutenbergia cavernae (strain ATCC BAA-8 / DSM 12333 / CCUG 43141 / JCM 11478 / NBRC 16432 / NCIMB 13614 / HKI 0122) TaxID=471853 RepID=C5C413_BEUC1|nr:nucleoside deaminase [Beutenbergia cavernae]ACQ79926.1 CMP/dCMP deaminase zinc-binding [Beutenbergia cavernae DSM 12333]
MPESSRDSAFLALAVDLATANVADGGGPFGALIVRSDAQPGDHVVATGTNRVTRDHDATAHAEVEAIRAAGRAVGSHALTGMTLYASCEPCPLCLAAALWARLDRLVYAADRSDAAAAGFDDAVFHEVLAGRAGSPLAVDTLRIERAGEPFDAWSVAAGRTAY